MTDISHDFSTTSDRLPLARVVKALQSVAEPAGTVFFLMGAAARDLLVKHAFKIPVQRQTEDVDFAVMVSSWNAFDSLRNTLIASGEFSPRPGPATHRLRHREGLPLDIVPFGGIERADRTIAWPPDQTTVFDCFGVREALGASVWVKLPGETLLRVASIPALVMLKITAWNDRKLTHPGKDAPDLALYLRSYMDCGNFERASLEHGDLFESPDFDYELAGARLMGRDVANFLDTAAIERLLKILLPEADTSGPTLLSRQSGIDFERMRGLVEAMCDELANEM